MAPVAHSYTESISASFADGLFSTTDRFCLIPERLYQEENKDLWLNFAREHITPQQQVRSTYVPSQGCYCVYEESADKQHVVPFFLQLATERDWQNVLIAARQGKQLVLVLLLQRKVQIAAMREVETKEDILYYMLNLLSQWSKSPKDMTVYTMGIEADTRDFLNEYIELKEIE